MTVQNEVEWLLDVIKTNYPGGFPSDGLVRHNGDGSVTYDAPNSPIHQKGVDPSLYNVVTVRTGSKNRELYGQTPQYRVETELDVSVEGKDDAEHGEISDDDEFKTLVAYVQYAINSEIVYPDVDTGDENIGRIEYLDLSIPNEQNLSADAKDYYRVDFTVRLRGNANP